MNASKPNAPRYRNILFCTDFSENARFAFDFAVDVATSNPGATLHLLHVIAEPEAQFWKGYIYEVGDMDEKAAADINQAIDGDYRSRLPPGVNLEVCITAGDAGQAILDLAKKIPADLIIIGRQGNGAITQWLLGNVTGKVTRKAACPVLVIPMAFKEQRPAAPPPAEAPPA